MPPTTPSNKCDTRPYFVVLSSCLPKDEPSVIVFNRSKSSCILNIFSAISHCKFSLDSLIMFIQGNMQLTLESCVSLCSALHWKSCWKIWKDCIAYLLLILI